MAKRFADVSPLRLAALNTGQAETTDLTEYLAVDQLELATHVLPALGLADYLPAVRQGVLALAKPTAPKQVAAIGQVLARQAPVAGPVLAAHPADMVRCWATYYAPAAGHTWAQQLAAIEPLANDAHFGVRETAWMALRPNIVAQPRAAIQALEPWVHLSNAPYLRRFAVEATRPMGVWAAHIPALKANPEWGLPLLEPLRADPHRYVQDAVANWLNDASKSTPSWVRQLLERWAQPPCPPATARIVKRAGRSL